MRGISYSTFFTFLSFELLVSLCLVPSAIANVEKEIFIAPPPPPLAFPALDTGNYLVPSEHCRNCRAIRSRLNTSFVGDGSEHWVQIDGLQEGKRYEVRICWAATQPTDFKLELVTTAQLLSGQSPLQEQIRHYPPGLSPERNGNSNGHRGEGSVLYLRVFAKTAYVSSSISRMKNPEPVDVDIILDPYLLNLIPESLLPIVGMIILVAVLSWWLGGKVYAALLDVAKDSNTFDKKKDI